MDCSQDYVMSREEPSYASRSTRSVKKKDRDRRLKSRRRMLRVDPATSVDAEKPLPPPDQPVNLLA